MQIVVNGVTYKCYRFRDTIIYTNGHGQVQSVPYVSREARITNETNDKKHVDIGLGRDIWIETDDEGIAVLGLPPPTPSLAPEAIPSVLVQTVHASTLWTDITDDQKHQNLDIPKVFRMSVSRNNRDRYQLVRRTDQSRLRRGVIVALLGILSTTVGLLMAATGIHNSDN